jgi:hypothetical protein
MIQMQQWPHISLYNPINSYEMYNKLPFTVGKFHITWRGTVKLHIADIFSCHLLQIQPTLSFIAIPCCKWKLKKHKQSKYMGDPHLCAIWEILYRHTTKLPCPCTFQKYYCMVMYCHYISFPLPPSPSHRNIFNRIMSRAVFVLVVLFVLLVLLKRATAARYYNETLFLNFTFT